MTEIKTKMNVDLLAGLQRKSNNKVVLLYSGGIDSTGAGLLLVEGGYEVYPLFIDYNQSAIDAESFVVDKYAERLGFRKLKSIKTDLLSQLSKSALLGSKANTDDDAWVPGRNTLFMTIAGIYAQQMNADAISLGYMLDDNFVFGDNDYFHHKGIESVLSKSFLRPMGVLLPTMSMRKVDLIRLLIERGYVQQTVSCWNAQLDGNDIITCNKCANCLERNFMLEEVNGD